MFAHISHMLRRRLHRFLFLPPANGSACCRTLQPWTRSYKCVAFLGVETCSDNFCIRDNTLLIIAYCAVSVYHFNHSLDSEDYWKLCPRLLAPWREQTACQHPGIQKTKSDHQCWARDRICPPVQFILVSFGDALPTTPFPEVCPFRRSLRTTEDM